MKNSIRNLNKKTEKGFTLIELMIVVAIIGILAAIAIPQFAAYRVRAFNAAAQSDLKTAQTTYEVFFNDNLAYPNADVSVATGTVTIQGSTTMNTSTGVFFGSKSLATTFATYGAATKHTAGSNVYTVTSDTPSMSTVADTEGDVLVNGDVPAAP